MRKSFVGEVKILDELKGEVGAVISTFDVLDHDGDVASKASFPTGQPVIMSAYNHQSWKGALPLGYGTIDTTDNEAHFKGQFLMNTSHGSDAFYTVKALSEQGLQEWSYSLSGIQSHKGLKDGKPARFLDSFGVTEVSPVIKGASIGTRTTSIKGADDEFDEDQDDLYRDQTKGMKFAEHTTLVMAQVKALVERASQIMVLRAEKGKSMSDETRTQLVALQEELAELVKVHPTTEVDSEVQTLWLQSIKQQFLQEAR